MEVIAERFGVRVHRRSVERALARAERAQKSEGDARRTAGAGAEDVERYEQLRARALGGEPSGCRLGLALLERRGVAAWARAWRRPPAPAADRPGTARRAAGGQQTSSSARWRAWRSRAWRRGERR